MAEVPLILMDKTIAEAAWEAHQALLQAEARQPSLRDNPAWQCLRADAYEQFCLAFERMQ